CVERAATSAIGPCTEPRADTPLLSRATTSRSGQSPTPASALSLSDGAYQFWIGISPPARSSGPAVAPKTLRREWHALQWPSVSTRYAPRFHCGDLAGSVAKRAG